MIALPAIAAPAVWFAYSPERKGEHPQQHLRGFRGFLQADAYAGFNRLNATHRLVCKRHSPQTRRRRTLLPMNKAIIGITLLLTIAASAEGQNRPVADCSDITVLDFKNATVIATGRTFAFQDGKAYNSDTPGNEKSDWEATIEKDTTVSPAPGVKTRFLLIDDSHLTGTGSWLYLMGFRCEPSNSHSLIGRLHNVFEMRKSIASRNGTL